MRTLLSLLFLLLSFILQAQEHTSSQKIYRSEKTRIHNLVHTKLKVRFDYPKRFLYGEAWITARPHFYTTQKLTLDAKAMRIHKVKMGNKNLDFNYDGTELIIDLDKPYSREEKFEVYINYTARPEEVRQKGSLYITDAKGLYFIDPDGTDPNKPTQIWTQGETEASSCWFPTIDSPNQKTTQEIYITVPSQYTTLSNGLLTSQTHNADNTRTDYWKMEKPHAPYLFFMGIGEYSIVSDTWNGIPVDYYVEKEYEDEAQAIFGNTPEIIQFFSDRFGVPYPWEKYGQIVVRDFVSGAMENTTATIHAETAYQRKGQLVDENIWEDTISHELIHQWFGDLVTTESWSNITLNESFANYGEYLWREYKYGKDHADAHLFADKQQYMMEDGDEKKNLVRFYYADREDVFDRVSYQKGGIILHMLRNHLGDEAFFIGLQNYLTQYQYGTAEVHQLRLALEAVSGKDLNIFFNQWYYNNGHPKLHISYRYDDPNHAVEVTVKQADKVFDVPLVIDVYESGKVATHSVRLNQKEQTFTFRYNQKPDLVNINADHVLLCEIFDPEKTLENYIFQYHHAQHFIDRRQAILEMAKHQDNEKAFTALIKALKDAYFELRILALKNIDLVEKYKKKEAIKTIETLATTDSKTKVRGIAIKVLGKLLDPAYIPIFERGMRSDSYSVKTNATIALYDLDKSAALEGLKHFSTEAREDLSVLLTHIYIEENDESQMPYIAKNLFTASLSEDLTERQQKKLLETIQWISKSNNEEAIQNFVTDLVSKGKRYKRYGIDKIVLGVMQTIIQHQTESNNSKKETLILIAKKGIAELLE